MWNGAERSGTGIVFNDFDANAMHWALTTALDLFQDSTAWRQLMLNGMAQDYSWESQGQQYERLYAELSAQG
jgi:starch synthase